MLFFFFFSSRRRHTRSLCDWSSDVCSSDLEPVDLDLLALAVAHDLGRDLGALHHRFPRLYVLAVAREQHAVERHLAPGLRLEQRDLDRDSRLGAKLGATGREDGIAHRARTLIST